MLSVAWVIDCRSVVFQVEFWSRDCGEGGIDTVVYFAMCNKMCLRVSPDSKYHSTLVSRYRYVSRHACVCDVCFKVCLTYDFSRHVWNEHFGTLHFYSERFTCRLSKFENYEPHQLLSAWCLSSHPLLAISTQTFYVSFGTFHKSITITQPFSIYIGLARSAMATVARTTRQLKSKRPSFLNSRLESPHL